VRERGTIIIRKLGSSCRRCRSLAMDLFSGGKGSEAADGRSSGREAAIYTPSKLYRMAYWRRRSFAMDYRMLKETCMCKTHYLSLSSCV
jgi:hypothetical protein